MQTTSKMLTPSSCLLGILGCIGQKECHELVIKYSEVIIFERDIEDQYTWMREYIKFLFEYSIKNRRVTRHWFKD